LLKPPAPRKLLPRHVAVIMDGNGRWAQRQGLARVRGHQAGAEAVRDAVTYCGELRLPFLTLYAFSTENWKRPRSEIQFLMGLLEHYLETKLPELHEHGVRLITIGRLEALPDRAREAIARAVRLTAANRHLTVCLALNYGAHDELVDAARRLCALAAKGELRPDAITKELLADALYTAELPPVDLLIRTAGERRLSNFLLWQACGACFYPAAVCWPEFRRRHFRDALIAYAACRQNRGLRVEKRKHNRARGALLRCPKPQPANSDDSVKC
jgi:undecaprenyl diphosphate synthase